MIADPPVRRLIYLVGTYPSLTTTFIDREIKALRGWGIDVRVIAMRHPPPELPLLPTSKRARPGLSI